jgi:molecular chaperone GrpE
VVGTVMRRGYKVGDQVLRHALVGVVDTVPDDAGDAQADKNGERADEASES